jgi:quercetin dioxygenase-like cupin family protein
MARYGFVPPGGGPSYNWSRDHTFVKVSAADTGGAYALMEDNLKREFSLGLHLHRQHAETFYILEGDTDFYIDGDWMTATPGTTVHIPHGIPHALLLPGGQTGKLLMIFQPAGFDQYLAELAQLTDKDFADARRMRELDERYDIIQLGEVPPR